jgi:NitT/TauT family transport system substrate-binding protein
MVAAMEKRVAFLAILAVALVGASCRRSGDRASSTVRLAIGGQNQLIYLPTTLARELGFYRDEGLDVELQDMAGGSKALEALLGGSADVVSGFYDHTIQMAADGREVVAFVTMLRFPGLVLVTSPQSASSVRKIEDLQDKIAGVTTAGSSSHMLLTYLLRQHGIDPERVSVTAIGTAATAVAAIEHDKVAAGMMAEPSFTFVRRRNPGVRVLADLRHADGVEAAFGTTTYPSSVLYAEGDWVRSHQPVARKLARAITRTLSWMQTHPPEEIAARTPASFQGDDRSVYLDALKSSMPMFSPDGRMSPDGAAAVRKLLGGSIDKVRNTTIDLAKTYTNEFVEPRADR